MNQLNVISINPGESTQAALHQELFDSAVRQYAPDAYSHLFRTRDSFRDRTDFIFGISKGFSSANSGRILSCRILAASGLAAFALLALNPVSMAAMICLGMAAAIGLGLFTRVVSFSAICAFGFLFWETFSQGEAMPFMLLVPVVAGLFFTISGPGLYSIDQLIRKSLLKMHKAYAQKRADARAAERLSYKAFRYQ